MEGKQRMLTQPRYHVKHESFLSKVPHKYLTLKIRISVSLSSTSLKFFNFIIFDMTNSILNLFLGITTFFEVIPVWEERIGGKSGIVNQEFKSL